MNAVGLARSRGIYSVPEPAGWAATQELVCSSSEPELNEWYCDEYSAFEESYPGRTSTKNNDHWLQGMETQRFQPYVEDWAYPDTHEATEYDLSAIQSMPISLFVGENDETCTSERADLLASELQTLQNHYVFVEQDHGYFGYGTDEVFVELLLNEVTAEVVSSPNAVNYVDTGAQSGLAVMTVVSVVMLAAIQSIF